MPPEDFALLARRVIKIAAGVQRGLEPGGLSLVQANGRLLARVMHVHVHVLPRRKEGLLLINWSSLGEDDPARIVELAGLIRAHL